MSFYPSENAFIVPKDKHLDEFGEAETSRVTIFIFITLILMSFFGEAWTNEEISNSVYIFSRKKHHLCGINTTVELQKRNTAYLIKKLTFKHEKAI